MLASPEFGKSDLSPVLAMIESTLYVRVESRPPPNYKTRSLNCMKSSRPYVNCFEGKNMPDFQMAMVGGTLDISEEGGAADLVTPKVKKVSKDQGKTKPLTL
ncbi:hypothetical protein E6O75_ATG01204 [Venturia nashicola]|uniref:Uncharacterized protein n=1 Tax=Venturia nashicola TaxID=86259 RepID=A0A4Z1PLF4_9PEZI|nr:hypothetical protein E6O75_ATG01204 [Venturia nashicola]